MGESTLQFPADPAGTYWRRRFVVLMVGLTVFAIAAWGLSDALKITPVHTTSSAGTRSGRGTGSHGGGKAPAGGTSPAASNSPTPAASNSPTPAAGRTGAHSPGPRRSPHPTVTPRSSPSPRPSGSRSGPGESMPAFCARKSIVLSVSASRASLGSGQHPDFSLSIVSTQRKACSFNVGSAHLALVITKGPTRLYSSAYCAKGSGSLVTELRRGVPVIVAISWSRRTSSPGCSSRTRLVPPGSYTGYAVDESVVSSPVTFRLR
jgi:hypothetical protein